MDTPSGELTGQVVKLLGDGPRLIKRKPSALFLSVSKTYTSQLPRPLLCYRAHLGRSVFDWTGQVTIFLYSPHHVSLPYHRRGPLGR